MSVFAVFDTNVLVSAMLSHNLCSSTVKVVKSVYDGRVVPLYNEEILSEYDEVLRRTKFGFLESEIANVIEAVIKTGVFVYRTPSNEFFPDSTEVVFYESALSMKGAFVVTGNLKHFPKSPIVVTPNELLMMLTEK